jgi:hypothetical protein
MPPPARIYSGGSRTVRAAAGQQYETGVVTAGVFDPESVFPGSFDLDPRSAAINTEIGVMIDSPEIAGQVGELMDEGLARQCF